MVHSTIKTNKYDHNFLFSPFFFWRIFILTLSYFIRIHDVESDGWLHFYFSMHPPFEGPARVWRRLGLGPLYVCGAHANDGPYPHIKVIEPHRTTHNVGPTFLSVNPTVDFFSCGPCTKMRSWPCWFFWLGYLSLYPHFESGPQRKN